MHYFIWLIITYLVIFDSNISKKRQGQEAYYKNVVSKTKQVFMNWFSEQVHMLYRDWSVKLKAMKSSYDQKN